MDFTLLNKSKTEIIKDILLDRIKQKGLCRCGHNPLFCKSLENLDLHRLKATYAFTYQKLISLGVEEKGVVAPMTTKQSCKHNTYYSTAILLCHYSDDVKAKTF